LHEEIEKNNLKSNLPIYIPYYFDFRGRLYYNSPISPTSSKLMRMVYHYGIYSLKDLEIKKIKKSIYTEKYNKEINFVKDIYKIKNYDDCIFWLLISIGKMFINKSDIKISIDDFIKKSIMVIKNEIDINNLEIEEKFELEHYLSLFKEIKKEKIYKKIVLKDATASVIQNLIRLLGPKDQNALNVANMGDGQN
jgi:hypothetical protein